MKKVIVFGFTVLWGFTAALPLALGQAPGVTPQNFRFTTNLAYGLRDSLEVRYLQQFLRDQGYFTEEVTGNFFNVTRQAVKDFQAAQNISPAAGFFGPLTRGAVNQILGGGKVISDQPPPPPLPQNFRFTRDLFFGLSNDTDVRYLQQFLTDEGHYNFEITGNFFNITLEAVRKFQEQHAISPVFGYFGARTRAETNMILAGREPGFTDNVIVSDAEQAQLLKEIAELERDEKAQEALITELQNVDVDQSIADFLNAQGTNEFDALPGIISEIEAALQAAEAQITP